MIKLDKEINNSWFYEVSYTHSFTISYNENNQLPFKYLKIHQIDDIDDIDIYDDEQICAAMSKFKYNTYCEDTFSTKNEIKNKIG